MHTWYTRIADENENCAYRANRYNDTQNRFEYQRKQSVGTSSALASSSRFSRDESQEKRSRKTVVTYFWAVLYFMVVCLPRGKLLLFLVYINSCLLTTLVEYFAIIGSRLVAACFEVIFQ